MKVLAVVLFSLTAVAQSSHSAVLIWTASSTAGATYEVFRAPSPNGAFTLVQSGIGSTTYTDANLAANTEFCYEIVSQSTGNIDSTSNIVCGATSPLTVPNAPTLQVINVQ